MLCCTSQYIVRIIRTFLRILTPYLPLATSQGFPDFPRSPRRHAMRIQSLTLLIHSVNSFPLPILDFLKNKKIALRFDGKFINFSEVK